MSYTDVFGNQTLPPAEYGFNTLTLTGNLTVFWPYNIDDTTLTIAKITEASCAAGNILTLPDAREVSVGEDFLIRNTGADVLQVNNALGGVVSNIQPGAASYFYLTDNTTQEGVFAVIGFGIGTSVVDAASLIGYGIKAIGASLNQSHPVVPVGSNLTIDATHRAKLVVLTGGASTFSLTSAVTLGDDFFTLIRNEGTGTLTIDAAGAETVDSQASIQVQPSESLMLVCTGVQWYSVGYGRSVLYQFTQLTKDVSGGGTITLTAAEASNKLLTFIGNPAADVTVVAPAIVAVYYTHNNLSTAHNVNFKTAAGAAVPIGQSTRLIVLCDGTDMLSAQSATANSSVSLVDGSAAAPALFFASQTNTGLFKYGVDGIGVSVGGVAVATFSSASGALIILPQLYSQYNTISAAPAYLEGKVFYDNVEHTLAYYNDVSGITVNIGQEHLARVRNVTGSTIGNGSVVYVNGASGGLPSVAKAKADSDVTSMSTLGLMTHDLATNSNGYCTVDGLVHDLDTSAWSAGTLLYLSAAIAGAVTSVRPVAPDHAIKVGYVISQHSTQGVILVRVDVGLGLSELHDVKIAGLANGDLLQYDSGIPAWKNIVPTYGDASTNTALSVDSEVALFSGVTGKLLKRAAITGLAKLTAGVLSAASAITDYIAPGSVVGNGITMTTAKLLGRSTAGTGGIEEITIGGGLSMVAGTLTSSGVSDGDKGDITVSSSGTVWTIDQKLTLGTPQATTSGTSKDFTGIPSWVKRITVSMTGTSTNGTSNLRLQLGTSGGVETSGYLSSAALGSTFALDTGGLALTATVAAASVSSGSATLTLLDSSTNTWACQGSLGYSNSAAVSVFAGSKALAGVLDRIRLTTVNGTDAFDAGSVNILYE